MDPHIYQLELASGLSPMREAVSPRSDICVREVREELKHSARQRFCFPTGCVWLIGLSGGLVLLRWPNSWLGLGWLVFLGAGMVLALLFSTDTGARQLMESRLFLPNGDHRGLAARIRERMHNPTSYEHVETWYANKGDHLIVETTFRGTNAFGGVVLGWVVAKTDLCGNVIELLAQGCTN